MCYMDVINLCRKISDGVRPFMPPCSLVSLYALTNISYLCLASSKFGISSNAMNSLFTTLLYASTFSLQLRIRIWYLLILYLIVY